PDPFSIFCGQAKEIAFGAEGINFTGADLRCNSRAGWITDRIGTVIFMFPERFAIRFIQADHALDTLDFAPLERVGRITHTRGKLTIGNINPAIGDGRPCIARANVRSPADRRTSRRKFLNYPCFAPNCVVIWPEPLRPVLCSQQVTAEKKHTEHYKSKSENSTHRVSLWIEGRTGEG